MTEATHFTDFDYIIIGVMVFSCVFAYVRGLVREILSLAAWIGAGVVTIYYFQPAAQHLQAHFRNPTVAACIAIVGVYMLALIGFSFINIILVKSIKSGADPGMLDNLLGLLFGACRGALMVSLGFFLLTVALPEREYPDWLKQSVTRPYVAQGAAVLAKVAPQYLFEISALEKRAQDHMAGNTAPAPDSSNNPIGAVGNPYSPNNSNNLNDPDSPNSLNNPNNDNTGYNRTTTQQLDRLIDSTGNQ